MVMVIVRGLVLVMVMVLKMLVIINCSVLGLFVSPCCTIFRYVDRLAFVLSSGKLLGRGPGATPGAGDAVLGGDGGGLRHTLGLLRQQFNVTNLHLDGVKVPTMAMAMCPILSQGKVVRSQGVELVTNLRFVYRVAADQALEAQEMQVTGPTCGTLQEGMDGALEDLGSEWSVDSEHWADPEDFEVLVVVPNGAPWWCAGGMKLVLVFVVCWCWYRCMEVQVDVSDEEQADMYAYMHDMEDEVDEVDYDD